MPESDVLTFSLVDIVPKEMSPCSVDLIATRMEGVECRSDAFVEFPLHIALKEVHQNTDSHMSLHRGKQLRLGAH